MTHRCNKYGRQYNLPIISEVAALIPGDGNPVDSRDVLIEVRGNEIVKRIFELHPSFITSSIRYFSHMKKMGFI